MTLNQLMAQLEKLKTRDEKIGELPIFLCTELGTGLKAFNVGLYEVDNKYFVMLTSIDSYTIIETCTPENNNENQI